MYIRFKSLYIQIFSGNLRLSYFAKIPKLPRKPRCLFRIWYVERGLLVPDALRFTWHVPHTEICLDSQQLSPAPLSSMTFDHCEKYVPSQFPSKLFQPAAFRWTRASRRYPRGHSEWQSSSVSSRRSHISEIGTEGVWSIHWLNISAPSRCWHSRRVHQVCMKKLGFKAIKTNQKPFHPWRQ